MPAIGQHIAATSRATTTTASPRLYQAASREPRRKRASRGIMITCTPMTCLADRRLPAAGRPPITGELGRNPGSPLCSRDLWIIIIST